MSRFWCYAVDPRPYSGPGHPAVFYRYSADRKGERPRGHLERFSGYLHADAFAGYQALYRGGGNQPPRIIHAACMAHARRKIFEVFDATKSPIAEEALRRIQELYAIEAEIKGKPSDQRREERQKRSKPLLDALHDWMVAQRRRLSGKTPLGKAFQYALSRWDALARYLESGRLSIDNNLAERRLRGIAVSRKNFLFLGSDRGGERAAAIYTLIESALRRARRSADYAVRQTMPNSSRVTHGCRSAVCRHVVVGSVPFGIVQSLRAPLGRQVIGRWGGSGFGCCPGMV